MMVEDGDILSLSPGIPEVIDSAPVGRLALDGNRVVPITGRRARGPAPHAVQRRRAR